MDKRFQGKTCPFCKTPFEEGDVIVVCSTCEMPHHLSCWQENNGCTTFGCTGTIKETVGSVQSNSVPPAPPKIVAQTLQQNPELKSEQSSRRFETLFESEPNTIQGNIPVLVEKLSLIIDHQNESLMARCIFRSLTDKPIIALLVDIVCTDVWGKPAESVKGFQFLDLKTKRDSSFGQTKPIPIPDAITRAIDIVIKKVLYADRTMVDASADVSVLPKQDTLEAFFGTAELAEEYARESNKRAKYVAIEGDHYWRCACGAINSNEESKCYRCNADKAQLLSLLNVELISGNLESFKEEQRLRAEREQAEREEQLRQAEERMRLAQEEKERKEKEEAERKAEELRQRKAKRKKAVKRTVLITAAVLLVGFLVYATGWHVIPYVRYQNACKALESQSFDEAYDSFVALGTFSDSSDKAIDTLYQKGVYLMNNGSYLEAATEFDRVPDYQDSKDQAVYCRNEAAYLNAKALFTSGNYKEAADAFAALSDYSDSEDQAKASNYLYGQELLESGEYEAAHTVFKALSGYEDSKNLADESYYRLAVQLFGEKKYDEAYTYFKGLSSYKDSKGQAKESKYLYAIERFDAGDYEKAVTSFTIVNGYKDVSSRLTEARYQYALLLTRKSDWKAASTLFKLLGNYKDCPSRYISTFYRYGLQLLSRKSYVEAAAVFENLGNYEDCVSRACEARYAYVLGHKSRIDHTTYLFLSKLIDDGYKDSKEIYKSLYAWKVTIVMNDSETDSLTNKTSISRYSNFYCHVTLTGGPPNGSIELKYAMRFPNGHWGYGSWDGPWYSGTYGAAYGYYSTPSSGSSGTFTIKVYNKSTGELLGEASIKIT